MGLNPLVLVGGAVAAVAAYAFSEKKKTEDTLVAQALPIAAQQVQMGVPIQQAAQGAAVGVVAKAIAQSIVDHYAVTIVPAGKTLFESTTTNFKTASEANSYADALRSGNPGSSVMVQAIYAKDPLRLSK